MNKYGETFKCAEADKVYDVMLIEHENEIRVVAINTMNRLGNLEGESIKFVLENSAHILYRVRANG